MDFSLSEDHLTLRDAASKFLDNESDLAPLLIPGATVESIDYDNLWQKMAALGWAGIVIPENYGGLGMSYVDLIMVLGELGRTLAPCPVFGTLAGSWAIEKAASEDQKSALLPLVAEGGLTLALAVSDKSGGLATTDPAMTATPTDDNGFQLTGKKYYVVDGASADKIIVSATLNGEIKFFLVDSTAQGVTLEVVEWRDITRKVCTLSLDGASAEILPESDESAWPWIRDRLYLVLAAESAAGTAQVLQDTVDYAKERHAFGRPIGGFQAIKHQLADIAGESECATAVVQYAAWALSENDDNGPIAAAMAQSYASDAYKAATFRNIQVFGAIGFTWEMKNHLYFKRARANSEILGASAQQREQVIQYLEANA